MLHDLLINLLVYVRGVWRYRWWILGIAWAVSVAGWIVVAKMPDQYQASARVHVDTQSMLKPLLRGLAVSSNERQRLLLVTRTLLSRPNLEKVMRMTDMDLQAKTASETDEIINELKANIGLNSTRDVNLYTITYKDRRPELAKLVVKSLLTIFVESNLGASRKDQDSTQRFLEQQIATYERRLVEAEARQATFKRANLAYLTEGGGYYAQLQENQNQLTQAELELKIQRDRLRALREQMEDAKAEGGDAMYDDLLFSSGASSIYDARISDLESKLDELLLRYTDKHPDVVGIRENIVELNKKRDEELMAAGDMMEEGDGSMSPIYQQLRITYADAKANVAAKKAVVNEYKRRIEKLKSAVDMVLKLETQAKQMNRDYGILKSQHQGLMKRLESARMGHDMDVSANAIQFRIVDPPRVPPKPSGPNRLLLSSGVLLGGLALGIAIAFLLSQLRPTFDDRRLLNAVADLPVLGSVGMVWTQSQRAVRRRRHVAFLLGLFSLLSVYGLVMAVYSLQLDWVGYLGDARRLVGI